MYVRKSIFQTLLRSPEKIIELGALLLMSPRLGLRNILGQFVRWAASSSPNFSLSCSVTQEQPGSVGLRPVGNPVREACFTDWYLCTGVC